jgi:hypothetical protein
MRGPTAPYRLLPYNLGAAQQSEDPGHPDPTVTYRWEPDASTASDYRQHCSDDRQNSGEFDQLTQEDRHRPASVFVLVPGPGSVVPDDRLCQHDEAQQHRGPPALGVSELGPVSRHHLGQLA